MMLCLDAGNTRLKCGLHDGQVWRMQRAVDYAAADQLAAALSALPERPTRIIACNVAGPVVRQQIEQLAMRLAVPLDWLESSAARCGVRNGYDQPTQLGADRWAALIAAHALHAEPVVVVLAGTATTIDQLDAGGMFCGGLILPGLTLMRQALARNTAGLPEASGQFRERPTNTDDAIVSGAVQATLGAIERMRAELAPGARCIVSGGAAAELLPHLVAPVRQIDHLVLEGLRCAAGTP
ncbi:MAG: type III pantothenate kinase [Rugosibacter sp.]